MVQEPVKHGADGAAFTRMAADDFGVEGEPVDGGAALPQDAHASWVFHQFLFRCNAIHVGPLTAQRDRTLDQMRTPMR